MGAGRDVPISGSGEHMLIDGASGVLSSLVVYCLASTDYCQLGLDLSPVPSPAPLSASEGEGSVAPRLSIVPYPPTIVNWDSTLPVLPPAAISRG